MRLLILTQKVDLNDPVLGFFHFWIEEFAKNYESVLVICLEQGDYKLPNNVRVLSLGKETGQSKIKYLFNFYKYIFLERNNYDQVFVHMNQIYVILGFVIWKILNKEISLWYTHKAVTPSLRLATVLVNKIFTASIESFCLKTKKINVVGHGVDTDKLIPKTVFSDKKSGNFSIITIGRIAKVKNQNIFIEAVDILKRKGIIVNLIIIGDPVTIADKIYLSELKKLVAERGLDSIYFLGSLPNHKIIDNLHSSDLFVNLSDTGSLDKAVLEAMASGILVVSSNKAFKSILEPFGLSLFDNKPLILAEKIVDIKINRYKYEKYLPSLRSIVVENHDLKKLIKKITLILCNK